MFTSCFSSLHTALTLSPRLVVTVTAEIRSLVVSGSCVGSGRCAAVCCCFVRGCFAELLSAMSPATSLLGVAGSGGGARVLCVATGASAIADVVVCGFPVPAGNSCCCCCVCVCLFCDGSMTKLVGVGVVIGVELMMSIICLLYLPGLT